VSDSIMVALITGAVSLVGSLISMCVSLAKSKQSSDLTLYRIDQLEEKVSKHNNLVERTYRLEEKTTKDSALTEQQLKTAWNRIDELRSDIEELRKGA
jgi:peptidoglycan hydrolase CwlO-like protein